eukprot:6905326-Pyramimonas_sp.AAC.1
MDRTRNHAHVKSTYEIQRRCGQYARTPAAPIMCGSGCFIYRYMHACIHVYGYARMRAHTNSGRGDIGGAGEGGGREDEEEGGEVRTRRRRRRRRKRRRMRWGVKGIKMLRVRTFIVLFLGIV